MHKRVNVIGLAAKRWRCNRCVPQRTMYLCEQNSIWRLKKKKKKYSIRIARHFNVYYESIILP